MGSLKSENQNVINPSLFIYINARVHAAYSVRARYVDFKKCLLFYLAFFSFYTFLAHENKELEEKWEGHIVYFHTYHPTSAVQF
jgi:hypothetical protein